MKKISFGGLLAKVRRAVKKEKKLGKKSEEDLSAFSVRAAKKIAKNKKIAVPRIIKVPKRGGLLPLIPIIASLASIGGIASTLSNVYKNIKDVQKGVKEMEEKKRHNKAIEQVNLGAGVYLRPYQGNYAIHSNFL